MESARIAIIGAGIGGLAAAAALRRRGVDVRVYEQSSSLVDVDVGAGVALTANSLRIIRRFDLMPVVDRTAVAVEGGLQRYRSDGTLLGGSTATTSPGRTILRGDLIEVFHAAVGDGRLHLGSRLLDLEPGPEGVRLRFADRAPVEVDGVVGADGIDSVVGRGRHPVAAPRFSGMVAYRGVVPAERVPDWPTAEAAVFLGEGRRRLVVFPVRRGELLDVVAVVPAAEGTSDSRSATADPVALRVEFAGWAQIGRAHV